MNSELPARDKYPVYVVDDDAAVRESLSAILGAVGFQVETFDSGDSFLSTLEPSTQGCLLIDVKMPGLTGLQVQKILASKSSQLLLVVMSGYGDIPSAVSAMKGGAVDFVEKPVDPDTLIEIVDGTMKQFDENQQEDARLREARRTVEKLTARERDVLVQLVTSSQNKVIAQQLGISPRTVEVHRARIMEKLQTKSLSKALRTALLAGLDEHSG